MPVLSLSCPACQAVLKLPENYSSGATSRCPKCRTPVTLPVSSPQAKTQSAVEGDGSRHEPTEASEASPIDESSYLEAPLASNELGRLGPYRILGKIGEGGMGMVYEAEDSNLRRRVALKVMLPQHAANPTARARFLREARAQAAVEHEHVAAIHLVGDDQAVPYIAMPLLKGQTLQAAIKANPQPPTNEILRIGREMAEGLAAAHAVGLIHRDIKPANVWLEGNKRRVKILDFGLARAAEGAEANVDDSDGPQTQQGAILGTPAYMSPEQAQGKEVDARTDLWSLGIVLYQMATGSVPFRAPNAMGTLMAVLSEPLVPPSVKNAAITTGLNDLILKLLAKDASQRLKSALMVAEEIQRLESERTVVVHAAPVAPAVVANDPWADIDASDSSVVAASPVRSSRPARAVERTEVATDDGEPPRKSKSLMFAGAGLATMLLLGAVGYFATRGSKPVPQVEPRAGTPVVVQPTVPPAPPVARTVDVLALCDPAKDAKGGTWSRQGADLVKPDKGDLYLPYVPPAEYDYTVEFTRTSGTFVVRLLVPQPGGRSTLHLAWSDKGFGFDEKRVDHKGMALVNGQKYVARVEVRKDRLRGYLGDTLVGEKVRGSGAALPAYRQVGFGSDTGLIVHRAEVRELSGPGTVTRGPSPPAGEIDLLALLDPARDAIKGTWARRGAEVDAPSSAARSLLEVPYAPADEYDLALEYTLPAADKGNVTLILSRAGRPFRWVMNQGGPFGYEGTDGKPVKIVLLPGSEPQVPVADGRKHKVVVAVRRGGWSVSQDGVKLYDMATDYSALGINPDSRLRDDSHVGLSVMAPGEATIHRLVVTEVTGRGTLTRGGPPAGTPDPAFFNGTDLTSWVPKPPEAWRIEGGQLVCAKTQAATASLTSARPYRDFDLAFEFRHDGGAVHSLMSHTRDPVDSVGNCRLNLRINPETSGVCLYRAANSKSEPLKPGEFVSVSVRSVGKRFTVKARGNVLFDGDLDGPDEGPIVWKAVGAGGFTVRNVRFTDLSPQAAGGAWVPLFNGTDLTGWQTIAGTRGDWVTQDGILSNAATGYLYTTRDDFSEFHLRAEVKCAAKANGGIYFRAGNPVGITTDYEAQIAGPQSGDANKTGSLYNLVKISTDLVPPDEWFTYEVIARGNQIRLLVNGKETANYTETRPNRRAAGHIVFQCLTAGGVAFRKVEIQEDAEQDVPSNP